MGKISGEIGRAGEETAAQYLRAQHYFILAQNYYSHFGEIDIVAKTQDQTIVFVEVKTYKPHSLVHPLEAITPSKKKHLRKTALWYLARHHLDNAQARFDLIIVENRQVVDHLENIF